MSSRVEVRVIDSEIAKDGLVSYSDSNLRISVDDKIAIIDHTFVSNSLILFGLMQLITLVIGDRNK
jgi:hypothetical protein